MDIDENSKRRIKTTDTVFDIIEILSESEALTVTEIAEEMGMAKSTVHNHLSTLLEKEYIVKETGKYRLGLKFLRVGRESRSRLDLPGVVQRGLNQMAEETDEIAWFMVEEYDQGVYVNVAKGEHAVQPYGEIGKRVDLHNIAAGKAILAELSNKRVKEIINKHGLKQYTENTITSEDELFEELADIQEPGIAFNDGENIDGHCAVASAIETNDNVVGSIVISGPKNRIRDDYFREQLPQIVSGTANAIELELGRQ